MKRIINPGKERKSITLLDNIVYSKTTDDKGNKVQLSLSLMIQHGNVESRLANGISAEDYKGGEKHPILLWIPGGGYRGKNKNLMVPEMTFLVERGYAIAFVQYRSSEIAHFPAQIIDVKTAIRFLKANAEKFNLDSNKVGIMGRSAGGHLAALAGMNTDDFISSEWEEFSSSVDAVCDWFGPVDIPYLLNKEIKCINEVPNYRWKKLEDTHPGVLLGGDINTLFERAKKASPPYQINEKVSPILIMHGLKDNHVPTQVSIDFYQKLVDNGYENQSFLYLLENADHGSDDFFSSEVKNIMSDFFNTYLKEKK